MVPLYYNIADNGIISTFYCTAGWRTERIGSGATQNSYVDRIKIIIKILNEPATHFENYHGTIITHSVYSPVYVCIVSINEKS